MTAHQRNDSYFPQLEGERQQRADEWLDVYLRLLMRIQREHRAMEALSYPQVPLDESAGTGKVRTAHGPNATVE